MPFVCFGPLPPVNGTRGGPRAAACRCRRHLGAASRNHPPGALALLRWLEQIAGSLVGQRIAQISQRVTPRWSPAMFWLAGQFLAAEVWFVLTGSSTRMA